MAPQLTQVTEASSKPSPTPGKAGFKQSTYHASADGADSNLLIMLHGLGDTDKPFAQLGQQLQRTLPQCAVLSLQGQLQVPLLGGGMWWEAWDPLCESELLTEAPHSACSHLFMLHSAPCIRAESIQVHRSVHEAPRSLDTRLRMAAKGAARAGLWSGRNGGAGGRVCVGEGMEWGGAVRKCRGYLWCYALRKLSPGVPGGSAAEG